ncbi:hypothetical protein ABZX85_44180 [Streptomyces sp. NPDC004539]|uniref:hypothetical protein n=1 Tax=Streptomyces sp. NPDC004539 TaxID=3154280 RepID=UPI0033BF4F7C
MKTRLLRSLPVGVAALIASYASTALVGPGTARDVTMLVVFGAVCLAGGFVVDALLNRPPKSP